MRTNAIRAIVGALAVMLAASCGSSPKADSPAAAPAAQGDELDNAIRAASDYLNENIPEGNKIVILNVQSGSTALSDYIIDELLANAVNDKVFSVVDRQQLDAIRAELDFQWAGEVDDNSAQEIGKMLGAQSIVSGAVTPIGANYRIRIRALEVQTAQVQGQFNRNFPASENLTALLKSTSAGYGGAQTAAQTPAARPAPAPAPAAQPAASSQGTRQQPAPIVVEKTPAPAQAAPLKNGTYTFYPRLRATQGGVDKNVYLDRIVVRSGYFTIFLVDRPTGKGSFYGINSWRGSYSILQDLDRPARAWNPVNETADEVSGGQGYTFQGITGTRFSFTNVDSKPPLVFDEIILGEPDK